MLGLAPVTVARLDQSEELISHPETRRESVRLRGAPAGEQVTVGERDVLSSSSVVCTDTTPKGGRCHGCPKKGWMDNILQWTVLSMPELPTQLQTGTEKDHSCSLFPSDDQVRHGAKSVRKEGRKE